MVCRPVGKAAGRSRRSFAENEELDKGPDQQHDRELPEKETLRKRHSSPELSVRYSFLANYMPVDHTYEDWAGMGASSSAKVSKPSQKKHPEDHKRKESSVRTLLETHCQPC